MLRPTAAAKTRSNCRKSVGTPWETSYLSRCGGRHVGLALPGLGVVPVDGEADGLDADGGHLRGLGRHEVVGAEQPLRW